MIRSQCNDLLSWYRYASTYLQIFWLCDGLGIFKKLCDKYNHIDTVILYVMKMLNFHQLCVLMFSLLSFFITKLYLFIFSAILLIDLGISTEMNAIKTCRITPSCTFYSYTVNAIVVFWIQYFINKTYYITYLSFGRFFGYPIIWLSRIFSKWYVN